MGQWGGCVTALQALTIKETEESIPIPEAEDSQVVFKDTYCAESVNLTEGKAVDWNLFTVTDLEQIEKKTGSRGIANLSAIQAVTKLNPNSSDYNVFPLQTERTMLPVITAKESSLKRQETALHLIFRILQGKQTVRIHLGAWSAK